MTNLSHITEVELYPRIKTNAENYTNNRLIEFDLIYSLDSLRHTITIRLGKHCFNNMDTENTAFNCFLSNSCNSLHNYKILNFLLENNTNILRELKKYMLRLEVLNNPYSLI